MATAMLPMQSSKGYDTSFMKTFNAGLIANNFGKPVGIANAVENVVSRTAGLVSMQMPNLVSGALTLGVANAAIAAVTQPDTSTPSAQTRRAGQQSTAGIGGPTMARGPKTPSPSGPSGMDG